VVKINVCSPRDNGGICKISWEEIMFDSSWDGLSIVKKTGEPESIVYDSVLGEEVEFLVDDVLLVAGLKSPYIPTDTPMCANADVYGM